LPEQDAVIVTTAFTFDMQAMLDALWEHLLPGLGDGAPAAAQDELNARLAGLALFPCAGAPAPADSARWSGSFTVAASADDGQPRPFPSSATFLSSVEVSRGAGGWQLTLIERDNGLTVPLGMSGWTVSENADRHGEIIPVGASGGWLDAQTLRAEVIFLETPHRMDITCSLPARTAEAVWRNPPLFPGRLRSLHCPS
jgi:hypothetical protein